jgi:hypothetical protein
MANKKPNEVSGWKNKLAALDSLPDEPLLDKNEQWQQLQGRLEQQQGRKRVLWYWAAAGILLLFTSLLWTINTKQSGELPSVVSVEQPNKKALLPSVSTKVSDTMYTVADLSAKTDTKSTHAANQMPRDTVVSPIQMPQPMAIAETVAVAKALPTIRPADTQLVAAVATPLPAKQKLKVVHINELNNPDLPSTKVYTGEDYMVKQIRLINQSVYSTASPANNHIRFAISSTKKISTN